jgi:WD40 repeat protein
MRVYTKKVLEIALFKEGRRIVTTSENKTLQIWDVEKRALVGGLFEGQYFQSVSLDNRRTVSGVDDGVIIIWDVDSKQMVFKSLVKHVGRAYFVGVLLPRWQETRKWAI